MARLFTEEELAELRRADEELDAEFVLTSEEMKHSRLLDQEAKNSRLDNRERKIAEYQAAYYEANKDKIAERQAAWQKKNREKWNAYQREYRKRKWEEKKNAAPMVRTSEAAVNV